jgi:hypothetical protein
LLTRLGVVILIIAFGLLLALGPRVGQIELGVWFALVAVALAVSLKLVGRAGQRRQR